MTTDEILDIFRDLVRVFLLASGALLAVLIVEAPVAIPLLIPPMWLMSSPAKCCSEPAPEVP